MPWPPLPLTLALPCLHDHLCLSPCLAMPFLAVDVSFNFWFDDTSNHKFNDTSNHKFNDTSNHKFNDTSTHKVNDTLNNKLNDSSNHKLYDTSNHICNDTPNQRLHSSYAARMNLAARKVENKQWMILAAWKVENKHVIFERRSRVSCQKHSVQSCHLRPR